MTANTRVQSFKKSLIVETAQILFSQNSYETVTVDDIARTAGFGKSTVYSFFASKEDILDTVIKTGFEQLSEEFHEISEADMDTIEALNLLIPLQYEFFLKYNSLIFTYFQKCKTGTIKMECLDDIRQLVAQKSAHLSHLMQRGIREGVFLSSDPDYLSWFVTSLIKGICMPSLLRKTEIGDKQKDIMMLRKVILEGILIR